MAWMPSVTYGKEVFGLKVDVERRGRAVSNPGCLRISVSESPVMRHRPAVPFTTRAGTDCPIARGRLARCG